MRARATFTIPLTVLMLALSGPANAAGDPYAADPLGLVPFIDTAQQVYSSGTDTWEVWVCQVSNGDTVVDLSAVVDTLNTEIPPYWQWLSGGVYTPTFTTGGTVVSGDVVDQAAFESETAFATECESSVASASNSSPNAALIVLDVGFDGGYGTFGGVCPEAPFTGCTITYPSNSRRAVVGAASVQTVAPFADAQLITIAHEMGHAQNWAHSYTGLTFDPASGSVDRYDNAMDVLSAGDQLGGPIGTLAYHRYEAGWLAPADVAIHDSGLSNYRLAVVGESGLAMVVIPGDTPGVFYTLETRRKISFDTGLPATGVAVHKIDQRRDIACATPQSFPETWPCFATLQRITPEPALEGGGTQHVIGLDDSATIGLFDISIIAADTTSFTVRISQQDSGRFTDDDGNFHEPNIELIAGLGITLGCNPPTNDNYCPSAPVTRAEMSAFLIRALGEEDPNAPYEGRFPDVAEDLWYTQFVEKLASLGITTGYDDGTFRPDALVTRAEMSAFITRAFIDPSLLVTATGAFGDVPATAWYADFAETLLAEGISDGCLSDPLLYCPDDNVLRDQMASFIARSLP